MQRIKRGLFSNEAGVGSAPNAAASADASHPVKQGLIQMLSVYIDTIVICSATAFMLLCSDIEPFSELQGMPYVKAAVSNTLGRFGTIFITIVLCLFAFTTLIGNFYYAEMGLMAIINLPVIIILCGPAIRCMNDYLKQKKRPRILYLKPRILISRQGQISGINQKKSEVKMISKSRDASGKTDMPLLFAY